MISTFLLVDTDGSNHSNSNNTVLEGMDASNHFKYIKFEGMAPPCRKQQDTQGYRCPKACSRQYFGEHGCSEQSPIQCFENMTVWGHGKCSTLVDMYFSIMAT